MYQSESVENLVKDQSAKRPLPLSEYCRHYFSFVEKSFNEPLAKNNHLSTDRKMKISKSIRYSTSWIKILKSKSHVVRKKIKDIG